MGLDYLDISDTDPYNDRFDALGFGSANIVDNLGTVNIIYMSMGLSILIHLLWRFNPIKWCQPSLLNCVRGRSKCHKLLIWMILWEPDRLQLSHSVIRTLMETYLDIFIVITISVVPNEYGTGSFVSIMDEYKLHDWFTFIYLSILWILIPSFCIMIFIVGATLFVKLAKV